MSSLSFVINSFRYNMPSKQETVFTRELPKLRHSEQHKIRNCQVIHLLL